MPYLRIRLPYLLTYTITYLRALYVFAPYIRIRLTYLYTYTFLCICFPYTARGPFLTVIAYCTLYLIYVYYIRIRLMLKLRFASVPALRAYTQRTCYGCGNARFACVPFPPRFPRFAGYGYLRIRKTYTYIYTIYVYVICISFLNTIISRKKFKFLLIFSDPKFQNFLENF